jgi:hypothetical protein
MTPFNRFIIYLLAAWSGFFVMGIELLGGRILSPYFGSSIFVWGGIITVFMTCLSGGYLLGGMLSIASPNLRKLGLLVLAEALLAMPIVGIGEPVLEALSSISPDPRYGSLLAAFLLFGVPTVISGMISPYAVRLLINDIRNSGTSAGRLYFSSTLGSAAGTIVTSFYLVLYFEINTIITSFILLSMLIGTIAYLIGSLKPIDNSESRA